MMFLRTIAILILTGLTIGCALENASPPRREPQEARRSSASLPVDAQQVARLQRIMLPLLRATNNPRP